MADNEAAQQEPIRDCLRGACHGLNNAISVLHAAAELAQSDIDADVLMRAAKRAEESLTGIVSDLRKVIRRLDETPPAS